MIDIELFIIICICIIPIVALVIVLPKNIAKKSKKSIQTEKPIETKKEPESVPVDTNDDTEFKFDSSSSTDEFKSYLNQKSKKVSKPIKKSSFDDDLFDDDLFKFTDEDVVKEKKDTIKKQSLNEQINNLSPEMKALLLSGILDKKDY